MAVDIESLSPADLRLFLASQGNMPEGEEFDHLRATPEEWTALFPGLDDAPENAAPAPEAEAPGEIPTPPPARTDLPRPEHLSEEEYAEFLSSLSDFPPTSWRAEDRTIYTRFTSSEGAPSGVVVDSSSVYKPGDPGYGRALLDVLPYFDFAPATDAVAAVDDAGDSEAADA